MEEPVNESTPAPAAAQETTTAAPGSASPAAVETTSTPAAETQSAEDVFAAAAREFSDNEPKAPKKDEPAAETPKPEKVDEPAKPAAQKPAPAAPPAQPTTTAAAAPAPSPASAPAARPAEQPAQPAPTPDPAPAKDIFEEVGDTAIPNPTQENNWDEKATCKLSDFAASYPQIAGAMKAVAQAVERRVRAEVEAALGPVRKALPVVEQVREREERSARDTFIGELVKDGETDAPALLGDTRFPTWLQSQPKHVQDMAANADRQDAAYLLSRFRSAIGVEKPKAADPEPATPAPAAQPKQPSTRQLAASSTSRGPSAAARASAGGVLDESEAKRLFREAANSFAS